MSHANLNYTIGLLLFNLVVEIPNTRVWWSPVLDGICGMPPKSTGGCMGGCVYHQTQANKSNPKPTSKQFTNLLQTITVKIHKKQLKKRLKILQQIHTKKLKKVLTKIIR